jgi:hypothetical protein
MTKTLEAIYDGEVLRPDEPLDIEPNTRIQITIETQDAQTKETPSRNGKSFLETARSLNLEGPPDWSDRLEEYLYGTKSDAER